MVFRDGILLYSNPGALAAEALDEMISAVATLNMDDIRKEVAEQNQKAKP
jgi:thioredoxin 1